jgi:hypothetical protein
VIKYFAATLVIFFSFNLLAQKKKKQESNLINDISEWYEGSIMLTGGEELKGLVKYNNRNGVLSFQDGSDSRVFTAMRVVAFEFFDESLMTQRVFYSFDYEDPQTSIERPLFFEVLKQYKTFAVLSKADQIDIDERPDYLRANSVAGYPSQVYSTKTVISQTETIYLMKSTGQIKPYFKIIKEDDVQKSFVLLGTDTKTKNKMVDRDLLEEFISPMEHEKLRQHALAHDLKFKNKEDFLKILDYYDEIVEK